MKSMRRMISSTALLLGVLALLATALPAAAWSGNLRWTYNAGVSLSGSPLVVGNTVLIGDIDGRLHAVDKNTGQAL